MLSYLAALALGIGLALWVFPLDFLFPVAGQGWRPAGDAAQHMVAQRYLMADAWRWPPTLALNLNTQAGGMNTAFADSIPLLALPLKALRDWLPEGFHGVGLFYGLAWLAQPVAAVFALRSAGEKRLLPALGIALAAASMPAWIGRFGHAALCGHFLLLLGLGIYLRLVTRPRVSLWLAAGVLQVAALLVHPYLAAMTLALLGAVPATRLLRGEAFIGPALAVAVCLGAVAAVMAGFGYLGAQGDGGYGRYALNLLSPFWPAGSLFSGWPWSPQLDATGHGGWEGYNWLGVGLLAALLAGLLLRPRFAWRRLGRHAGLAVVLLGLTALAASFQVGFGQRIVLDLGPPPAVLEQFRASGRFFWPVAYALLLAAMVLLARVRPVLCLAAGLLQFVDATPLRAAIAGWAQARPAWHIDAPALRAEFATARALTLLPSWHCVTPPDAAGSHALTLEILALAAERAVPASTMYVARWREAPVCRDEALASAPLAPGELRLFLPAAQPALLPLVPAADCRTLGPAPLGQLEGGQLIGCR
ncbi:DUF6311 domain-containing protein [Falsiroseomonas sp.]|uniref:DUF6311 domain-containing protein n=1 Tax=Falsiroseomonas sp. TaxID=2870721 RepID=UPI002735FBF8|nr:DUF6311 domain-containing protein [Falsiroseomonas sp.]MDP3417642.1 DUF6311 domain-containing protein [Falsiroseomonas sp.]